MFIDCQKLIMAYIKLIKTCANKVNVIENIKKYIDNKIRIHTRDIQYAIRHCNKKVISLMLDNIPKCEHFPCFYAAAVNTVVVEEKENQSFEIIDLLFERNIPIDDNVLMYCILNNKIDFIDYLIEKDPRVISVLVLNDALKKNDRSFLTLLVEKIKKHKLHIDKYEFILKRAYDLFLSESDESDDNKENEERFELLCGLQEFNPIETVLCNEKMEELYHNKSIDMIKQNTQIKTTQIACAIEIKSVDLLMDILPKYDRLVSNELLALCADSTIHDLIKEHNEKYTSNVKITS